MSENGSKNVIFQTLFIHSDWMSYCGQQCSVSTCEKQVETCNQTPPAGFAAESINICKHNQNEINSAQTYSLFFTLSISNLTLNPIRIQSDKKSKSSRV